MSMDFRPLTLAELLDRSFTLYRRHFWFLVGIMAIPSVFALGVGVLSDYLSWLSRPSAVMDPNNVDPVRAVVLAGALVFGMLAVMLVYLVVYVVALGATTLAVSEIYVGRVVTIGQVYGRMRGHFGALIWMMTITGVRIGLVGFAGLFLGGVAGGIASALVSPLLAPLVMVILIVPFGVLCVYMMLRYGLAVPALVLEELGGGDAVRRSITLTRGHLGRVLLLTICATLIAWAALALFQGPFAIAAGMMGPESITSFWLTLTGTVLGTIASTFTGPIMVVGLALLYYDVRIRKEGLDLQLMGAAIDRQAGLSEPTSA